MALWYLVELLVNFHGVCILQGKKTEFSEVFDTLMPSVALAQGFGRIGCLLAGCCYGKETSGAFSITFHTSAFAPNGVALVPTQIYSSILDFLHYGLLLLILRSQKKDGETAAAYLIFIVQEDLCWSFSAEIWLEEVWECFLRRSLFQSLHFWQEL